MISLEPPFLVLDGHAVLPDHQDELLWHVMPTAPGLVLREGRPALDLTVFADDGAGEAAISGGFLTVAVDLAIKPEVLADLPGRIQAARGLPGTPQVTPVAFESGTVELAVLGRTSAPQPNGSAAPGGPFEVTFTAGGRPTLSGTNEAAFQLLLDERAGAAVLACLDEATEPVLVTYVLTYAGLRPAFDVSVAVDWSRVYHFLQRRMTATVKSALEESGISVTTDVLGTAAGDRSAAERTQAQLLDWVMDRMFEPMVPPTSTADTISQVIDDTIWSLARVVIPGASYRLRTLDESQVRRMDIRASERVAELREVRPQGTIDALLRSLRTQPDGTVSPQWPAIREAMVHRIEISAFPRLEVSVSCVDRFASDGLRSVDVELARTPPEGADPIHAEVTALAFVAGTGTRSWVVNLLDESVAEPVWKRPFSYRVVARFDPSSPLRPGDEVATAWQQRRATDLLVDPREAYAVTDVSVTVAPLFSFDLFPAVTVELHPGPSTDSAAGAPAPAARVQLDATNPVQHWVFTSPPGDPSYSYRATYHRPVEAGGPVVGPWASAVEPFLSLPDPMPEKLTVAFFVALPWDHIALALLAVRYEDRGAGIRYAEETITLDSTIQHLTRTYSIAAGGSRAVEYRLTIQRTDGALIDGSWRQATDDRIVVDSRLVEDRQVRISVLGSLTERALARAMLRVEAREPGNAAVRAAMDVDLGASAGGGIAPFVYLLGDPPLREVWWQLTTVDANGFPAAQPWGHGVGDLIVVDLRSLTVTG
jgi:hypothetical protein